MDQAEKLRMKLRNKEKRAAKTIAVVSGKGGVGKSNITISTALAMAKRGKKVLVFDLDLGMGNTNLLLGMQSRYTITDYLQHSLHIQELIYQGPGGIWFIAGGNGFAEVLDFTNQLTDKLLNSMEALLYDFDVIFFDMGAGATGSSIRFLLSVDDIFVVTTPEPTSMTDAYSMMKFIHLQEKTCSFYLICNRSDSEKEGRQTLVRLQKVMNQFLHKDVNILGTIPEDIHVRKAVTRQEPFYLAFPRSPAAWNIEKMLESYLTGIPLTASVLTKPKFVVKLRRLFSKGGHNDEET